MKLKHSLFSSLFLIGVLFSCVQKSERSTNPPETPEPDTSVVINDPVEPAEPIDPIPGTPPTVDIAVYEEYPEAIDGCACYFGRTASELSEGKYIFMTNYEKKAYMELDGEMRVFDLVQSTDLDGGRLMETWTNEHYEMVIKTTEQGQIDETWQKVGTINIKPTDKYATMINVVGECGC